MASPVREVNWSELQRDPKKVAEIADEDGGVRVIRRDGVNLILSREDRVQRGGAGAVLAARVVRQLARGEDVSEFFSRALLEEFPWIRLLPDEDLPDFVQDFVRTTLAAAELVRWDLVDRMVREWKASADIHADAALAESLTGSIDGDFGTVTSPEEDED